MIRSSFAYGRYAAENDVVFGTTRSFVGAETRGVIFCHGSGENAGSTVDKTQTLDLCDRIARRATVHVGDLGLQTWGNDTAIARIGDAYTSLHSTWGVTGPVVLVAGSMGFSGACAYALAHPDNVLAIAGIIPLTDITDIMTRGPGAEINAAYGGVYDDAVNGPTHNPVRMALPTYMPIHIWTAPADPITPPATADEFVEGHPQTERTILSAGQAHTVQSVAEAAPAVAAWVHSHF